MSYFTSISKLSLYVKQYKDTFFIGKKPLMPNIILVIIQLATIPLIKIKDRGLT